MNVKAKGYPDKDDFVEKALEEIKSEFQKKMKSSFDKLDNADELEEQFIDELEAWFDGYMEHTFWDDVEFEKENIEMTDGWEMVVTGRSGGYWGVSEDALSTEDILPSDRLIKEIKDKFNDWYDEEAREDNNFDDEDDDTTQMGDIDSMEDALDSALYSAGRSGEYNDDRFWTLTKVAISKFKDLKENIEGIISDMESTERHVEPFMDQELYAEFDAWKNIDFSWDAKADRQNDFKFEKKDFGKKILITEDTPIGFGITLERGDKIQVLKEAKQIKEAALPDKVEAIIKKYEAKDYWEDNIIIDNKIKFWVSIGSPEEVKGFSGKATEASIREVMVKGLGEERRNWIAKSVERINKKDEKDIKSFVRGTQPFMKEVFTAITGLETKGMSDAKLDPIIKQWCNS
jgi:hypothetical protein